MINDASKLFSGIFKDKKILVTGHTGFKGAWLSFWLYALGASVVGYALESPSEPNLFNILELEDKLVHIYGDIRDKDHLQKVINQQKPEIVFHTAAQSLVRYSYKEPIYTYETNIIGTANLLEAIRKTDSVRVVVNLTSDKCYENKEIDYAYKEDDPMGGFDPYSSSKGCAELITAAYRNSFFKNSNVNLASVRAGNVVGGGDWAKDRLIPDCVRALNIDKEIRIRNPKAIRPWQHVLEPLSGYMWLASSMWQNDGQYNEGFNFGPDKENTIEVAVVVEEIIKEWGQGSWKSPENLRDELHEAKLLMLDNTKAKNKLGWQPVYSIEETLRITTAWYREFYEKRKNMTEVSLIHINNYVEQARKKRTKWALDNQTVGVL